ncbi:MAG: L-glutamate gamma-semialdehyde dehydrogenase [Planctomycetes bacterium]|nr:L-glutamate gamma-semialdehyde dehydrogenase [Planctomycetota bacterium]MCW8136900.1 L-glutamate gamma-semialdehyde dehydrogenase [Planctomycetota bacterium]
MPTQFVNEPINTDWSSEARIKSMRDGFAKVRARAKETRPLRVGKELDHDGPKIESLNPCNHSEVLGSVIKATRDIASRAVEHAHDVFTNYWRKTDVGMRARILMRAAGLMRRKYRDEFNAYLVLEAGKSWTEADADTAETIDFCEFYAREALKLQGEPQHLTPLNGEDNNQYFIPLGVVSIIPPWNFPLAIMAGMTVAAIVTGNTVVMKPASVTPLVAARFVELLEEAGLPPGVLQFVPGGGSEVGNIIVEHAKTRMVAFTGSKEVGLNIAEKCGKVVSGQVWVKRTILEMGGKDAMLIDEGSDLDDAAAAIVASAFGFQGQKCSACSRAIFVGSTYDKVVPKVVELASKIKMGPTEDPANFMGAVIDKSAQESIMKYIAVGTREGKLLLGGKEGDKSGYFVQPTIFGEVNPDARIHCEEIFGPVLACLRAYTFEQGLDIVNSTEFGLTGAVYSRNAEHLELARRDFHVGNLYFNRKCTGALVGSQPFGGFNMSGTDSKAGGKEYLLLFTQAKLVSEKTSW